MSVVHIAVPLNYIVTPEALPYRSQLSGPGAGGAGPPLGAWAIHNAGVAAATAEIEFANGTSDTILINSGDSYPLGPLVTGIGDGGTIAAADVRLFY